MSFDPRGSRREWRRIGPAVPANEAQNSIDRPFPYLSAWREKPYHNPNELTRDLTPLAGSLLRLADLRDRRLDFGFDRLLLITRRADAGDERRLVRVRAAKRTARGPGRLGGRKDQRKRLAGPRSGLRRRPAGAVADLVRRAATAASALAAAAFGGVELDAGAVRTRGRNAVVRHGDYFTRESAANKNASTTAAASGEPSDRADAEQSPRMPAPPPPPPALEN